MRNVILLFLLIVGWTTTVYAQNEQETIEVTGIVTDPKNEPLIGVNVTARNMPGFGAITDINGRYMCKHGRQDGSRNYCRSSEIR